MGTLTNKKIEQILQKGNHYDGNGLKLRVDKNINKNWIVRYQLFGTTREMGLGKYPYVSLKDARRKLFEVKKMIFDGTDPLEIKKERQLEKKKKIITFQKISDKFIKDFQVEWSNKKHIQQWTNTLNTYASPIIGKLPIDKINSTHVCKILKPIWITKHETASRVRQRLERIFSYCIAQQFMKGPNPAAYKDNLQHLLPNVSKIISVKHHRSLDYHDVPYLINELQKLKTTSSYALTFLIATATRTSEVIGATWKEIDLKNKVWTIPAPRMKMRQEHSVPLNDTACYVLNTIQKHNSSDFIFLNNSKKSYISNNNMRLLLKNNFPEIFKKTVPHGFRSSFRDWAEENHNFSSRAVELCLAHSNKNKVEKAYLRSDLFLKRQSIMQEWNKYLIK
ncbi:tyrosine-type recombinase/integrase [Alphaproteobacteria bacterium]|nr:tyrosine-type recombinase/integrase [Alphaproteobacteria bacterium]